MVSYSIRATLASFAVFSLLAQPILAVDGPGGLKITTTEEGPVCSRRTKNGDRLVMNYRGVLQNGKQFDTSYGKDPFEFVLGAGQVIQGWDLGLKDMCIGEHRQLIIPANMGYGSRGSPPVIPPNAVLIFDTELLSITGVTEEKPKEKPKPSSTSATSAAPTAPATSGNPADNKTSVDADKSQASKGSKDGPKHHVDAAQGECRLLGSFALLIQGALGALALLSLVWKRLREHPRRPVKVWAFDVSKQVVGSIMVHFANLVLSMISAGRFEIKADPTDAATNGGKNYPNPCSFYLLNLAIDTTIGIPILVIFLRVFYYLFLRTPLANPPESLKSGNYGNPPNIRWWAKQAFIYFLGLMAMKAIVFLLFQIFPFLGWVGDWALRWTEGKEWVQITFVMLIFPLIMNAAQYWIIDSFIKDPAADYQYDTVHQGGDGDDDDEADESREFIHRAQDSDDECDVPDDLNPHGVPVVDGKKWSMNNRGGKEGSPLPLPSEFDEEDEPSFSKRK